MYFVHPQIQFKDLLKAKLALFRRVDEVKLKERLSVYFPDKQVVFTDMGRSAFKVILEKLELKGSEIIMPSYICDIFFPILEEYDIKPVFVDIDNNFHLKIEDIENKITQNTKAIFFCHTYGAAFDVDRLSALAKKYNLKIIEDCAHAFGLKIGNTYAGNFGDVSFFSLYKQFPCLRGGMLVCPRDWNVSLPSTFFNFRDFISFLNHIPLFAFLFKSFGSEVAKKVPRKEKLLDAGGISRVPLRLFFDFLPIFEKSLENRKKIGKLFSNKLKERGFEIQSKDNSVFCYISALVPEGMREKRYNIVKRLREYGVFCTRMWHTPIILNEEAKDYYKMKLEEFPNTIKTAERVINFPLQNHYKERDINRIVKAIDKVLSNIK
jgi:dTDP-4-amino-4,6-dideoxygalactose transaminase